MDNLLATILGKKLPKNKGLSASYQVITKKIVGLDTVDDAVIRIKDLLAEARDVVQRAESFGPRAYVYEPRADYTTTKKQSSIERYEE